MIAVTFTSGDQVYSKRCGRIGGFNGLVVEKRGNGYQVLDPKTGATYQRDFYDLLPLKRKETAEVSA